LGTLVTIQNGFQVPSARYSTSYERVKKWFCFELDVNLYSWMKGFDKNLMLKQVRDGVNCCVLEAGWNLEPVRWA